MKFPRVIHDIGFQAVGNYVHAGAQALRSLFLARILGPADFGLVSAVNLAVNYLLYLDLGASLGVQREVPMEVGRDRPEEADAWESAGLVVRVLSGTVGALLLAVYTVARWASLSSVYRWCLLIGCAVVSFQALTAFAQIVLQARRRFRTLAVLTISVAVANLVLGVAAGYVAGPAGVLAAQAFVLGAAAVVVVRSLVRPQLKVVTRKRLKQLLRIGGPLLVLQALGMNLVSIDQVLSGLLLGIDQLGLYTLAMFAGLILQLVALSIGQAVGPRLFNAYGRRHEIEDVRDLTWRPVWILSLILPPATAFLWLVAPLIIEWVLPAYVPVIGPMRINIVGVFFLAINYGVSTVLVAVQKHWVNIPIVSACLGLNIAIDLVLVNVYDLGLTGIAIGSLVTYTVYWFVHTMYVRHLFEPRLWRALRLNLAMVWPGALLVGLLLLAATSDHLSSSQALPETVALAGLTALSVWRWHRGRGNGVARGEAAGGGAGDGGGGGVVA